MKVIKFEKQNCAPCEQVSQWLNERGVAYEAVNAYDQPETAREFRVRTVPTVLVFNDAGEETGRAIGFKPEALANILSTD